jgi:uncharacterized protein (DUF58 family)
MNSRVLTLVLIVFGLLVAALFTRNGDVAWMALPFLVYLGIGILQAPSSGKIHLLARRSIESNRTNGVSSIDVNLTVTNQGGALHRLCLADPLQSGMRLTGGQIHQEVALRAGEGTSLAYTFQAERGSFSWETLQARLSDPFGLVETSLDLDAASQVQVHPELNKFRPLPLRPQRTLPSAGSIPARKGGCGTDFWGVREYHPGDPLRRLDWRLTARHPRKFFTKEFEQEEIADIGLILDARRKTDLRAGEDSLFEHSARAAASLAEVFLRQGNRVSLLVYGKPMVTLFPGYGKLQLSQVLHTLARTTTESDVSLGSLQYLPVRMFASRSLILVISPLASNDWQLFPRLRAYGYQVLLISPDPFDYARRMLEADPPTILASRLARLERQQEISKITQLWIPVINWRVSQPLSPLVRSALRRTRAQRGP